MQIDNLITILSTIALTSTIFYAMFRVSKYAFLLNLVTLSAVVFFFSQGNQMVSILLYVVCPLLFINTGLYVFLHKNDNAQNGDSKYQVSYFFKPVFIGIFYDISPTKYIAIHDYVNPLI